ncbi:MAG TPA: substrate-binding domain-containing protein, partial [Candidatus Egerieimonas intestinavium]|nr:substrate-binding domain-containing protein [Candidatus Egerieimonas intestinavium]
QLNDIFNDLLFYLGDIANARGYQIALINVQKTKDYYATEGFINTLVSRHYDAIFIMNSSLTEQQINRLAKSGTKVLLYVTRDYDTLNPSVSCIVPNYRTGVKEAVTRLIDMGHTKISILPNLCYPMPQYSISNHRFAGYMDAFTSRKIPLNMEYIPAFCQSLSDIAFHIHQMFDKTVTPEPPTAICADEPFVVATVLKQLTAMKLRVPEDVSLVCFSNSTLTTITTPELTAIGFETSELADISMEMIQELIEGKSPRTCVIELNYYSNGSIATPPVSVPTAVLPPEYLNRRKEH